jgi:O-succinylbenzoic acid--CoA ligase
LSDSHVRVPDWLAQRAYVTPDRRALVCDDSHVSWTFAELDARVDAAVATLQARSIAPGERIGIFAPNSAGFVVAVHALMRLGAVIVPLNIRLSAPEVAWQREDAELRFVLESDDLDALSQLDAPPPSDPLAPLDLSAPAEPSAVPSAPTGAREDRQFDLSAPHSIIYTSGTTGRPKGAVLTYGNHWWSAVASALNLGLSPSDSWLACLPLFHVGGQSILLRSVIYGMTAVVHTRFDPAAANHAIDADGVSIISVVSTMLERMLSDRHDRPFPSTLRCVLLGGGPAPLPLLERALRAGAPVVQTYGLTETSSQVATLAPEDAVRKVGSAGKPLMGTEVRIGEDGEICVRGPSVSPGYLHQPPRADEWLRTGDVGYLDASGYLYVLDRRDDLIVSGGENVYPAEVEAALLAHPSVEEVGVFGVPHAEWGAQVQAAVKSRDGMAVSESELLAFCRQRLAGYKVPRHIEFRAELPRNAAGKLLRRELRTQG